MQRLLVAAGVYGCRKAPEPNCKGKISMIQRQSRRGWGGGDSPTPTADQMEENLRLPTAVKAEEGNTLLQVIAVGQMVLVSPERQTVCTMETQNTNPGRMDRQLGKAAILGEEATLSKNLNRRNRMTQPTWRG